ncbi:retrovirus-related Pol polyprotein from transposon 17.6 [Nephila pilipes]|uniref:Retrovirus-related Pol polyprotein from transposon 17.6 n=1 Tax=Nephila pilipes TaxID=299642 RepID=A0A8X6TSX4_NEPPI|nr:retrovirus-related Pol polyprotein from transposon 17.6 [Nephila pilipes]
MQSQNVNTACRPPIFYYGCGNPGFIKAKCPKCSLKKDSASVNAIQMFTCITSPVTLLNIEVYEATDTVYVDTGASHTEQTCDRTETSDLHLREEGQDLDAEERNDLTVLLNENKEVFRLEGEPTPNSWITPKGIEVDKIKLQQYKTFLIPKMLSSYNHF